MPEIIVGVDGKNAATELSDEESTRRSEPRWSVSWRRTRMRCPTRRCTTSLDTPPRVCRRIHRLSGCQANTEGSGLTSAADDGGLRHWILRRSPHSERRLRCPMPEQYWASQGLVSPRRVHCTRADAILELVSMNFTGLGQARRAPGTPAVPATARSCVVHVRCRTSAPTAAGRADRTQGSEVTGSGSAAPRPAAR